MRIAVLGAGLMGPAIAMDCVESDEVEEVLLVDRSPEALDQARVKLGSPPKLATLTEDVSHRHRLAKSLAGCDVVCIALSWRLNTGATWSAIGAGAHVVDLSAPAREHWKELDDAAKQASIAAIPGCGVEPGLTDMLAAYGMDKLDSVNEIDIMCGGIPQNPKPPLDYKIVFGGLHMPLYPGMVKIIEDGEVREVKRYTLGDPVHFDGIDKPLEAFYDRFPETLYEVEKFKAVKRCTNRTVRYAGYCEKVNFLDECGLLDRTLLEFEGRLVVPFEVFSKIVYPKVRLEASEKDITVLRVVVKGIRNGHETSHVFEMIDFYDRDRDITSMAKTTSFTAAIVARMLGRGELSTKGLVSPVRAIRGRIFQKLLKELAERSVEVKMTSAQTTHVTGP